MKKLNKMLFREIKSSRSQFIAAITIVLLGIAMFTAAFASYRNLKDSKDYYYEKYKFMDYYASAAAINSEAVNKIKAIEGVKTAEGRTDIDVGADMDETRRVTVRLLSVPDERTPVVNDVYMVKGNYLSSTENTCLISRSFAQFHKLEPGSILKITVNGKKYELKVKGIVESPEYIYEIRSSATPAPSPEDFGIVYLKESELQSMTGAKGLYNEVHVIFEDNAERQQVIKKIEEILNPFGFIAGVERKDQISNAMVNNEIEEMKGIAAAFPALFLSVAAMIIYIMLKRIISNQRTSIGMMKALGYKNRRILWHYVLYSLVIALIGSVLGTTLGMGLSVYLTRMYTSIFNIPFMNIKLYADLFLYSTLISLTFCFAAGYISAKTVLKIQPAEAMRSEAPKTGKRILLEKVKFIWNNCAFGTKISIRNLFRNRKRALLTIFSTSLTMMFILVSMFFIDSMNYILKQHFQVFQKQDYKISYSTPQSIKELSSIDGIEKSEPLIELPFQINKNGKVEDTVVVGISKNNSLYSLIDKDKKTVNIPEDGILISERIAEKLSLKQGDMIAVTVYTDKKSQGNIKVAGIVKQYAGFNCYMNIKELQNLAGLNDRMNGALLKIDTAKDSKIRKELLKDINISTIEGRQKSYDSFMQLVEFMYVFLIVMVVFGCVMGFSIIFNTTVINLMERKRELASLKVLGYSKKEIKRTIFKENMMLGILALIPGLIIGRVTCSIFAKQFSNDFFTFEIYINPRTYFIAALSMFLFIALAQYANKKNIVGLDMIEVLKNREG